MCSDRPPSSTSERRGSGGSGTSGPGRATGRMETEADGLALLASRSSDWSKGRSSAGRLADSGSVSGSVPDSDSVSGADSVSDPDADADTDSDGDAGPVPGPSP